MRIRNLIAGGLLAGAMWAADPAVAESKKLVAAKKYDEALATLEKAEKAHPKAVDVQKALGETYLAQADSYMADESLPPRQKYPNALRAYRKVLVYDKTNKKAQEQIASIEGIYKSMGRPVPQ